jgi:lipoprotein
MRKRTIALAAFLLTGTLFTACGSESNVETVTSEISEEADISAEESPADIASAPTVDPEEEYKNGYDYLLYYDSEINEGTRDYPVILGFNYPYKADSIINSTFAPSRYNFDTKYTEVIDSVPYRAADYFTITSEQYEITSDNKLIYAAPNFTREQDDTDVEEKGEVETPYGTAKVYFAKTHEEGFDDRCKEVALLNTGDYTVTLIWGSSGDLEEYSGTLETLIPLVFSPIEVSDDQKIQIDENSISADESYSVLMKTGSYGNKVTVFGFNPIPESENWYVSSTVTDAEGSSEKFQMDDQNRSSESDWGKQHGSVIVTYDPAYFNYFFGGRGMVTMDEKASVETPFGTAKIFYATRQETVSPESEEVAVINNLGTNIIIDYCPYDSISDGTYRGKLEEIIPKLFN